MPGINQTSGKPWDELPAGYLTDADINANCSRLFKEDTYIVNLAQRASYDLRLGDEVYISGEEYPQKLTIGKFIIIPRGQFAMLMTEEFLQMPDDCLGFISMRFSVKAQGLINVSGFHVDPGFRGKIIFSVYNAGPREVVLKYKEATFMIFFYKLNHDSQNPWAGTNQSWLPTNLVTSLRGTSASLSDIDKRVSSLEVWKQVFLALLLALIGALLAILFRGLN